MVGSHLEIDQCVTNFIPAIVFQTMKLAVKQPSESMPNILNEEEEEGSDSMPATAATNVDEVQEEGEEQVEQEADEEDEGKYFSQTYGRTYHKL